jgi:hypothetical protein
MKGFIFGCMLIYGSQTFGAAVTSCPNLSGSYQVSSTLAEQFSQTQCTNLQIRYGHIGAKSVVTWGSIVNKFFLDGRPVCAGKVCVTGQATATEIDIVQSNEAMFIDSTHSLCGYTNSNYVRTSATSLTWSMQATNCRDGYTGPLTQVLNALQK